MPGNFDVALLITLYAIVILGGLGSIAGVLVGAIVINVTLQFLAPSNDHPGAQAVALLRRDRPHRRADQAVDQAGRSSSAGTVAFGFVFHAVAGAIDSSWTAGPAMDAGSAGTGIEHWVIIPQGHPAFDTWAYIILVALIVATARCAAGGGRVIDPDAVLGRRRLGERPRRTAGGRPRLILFGALLIALMQARPQGLLGTARVEIV